MRDRGGVGRTEREVDGRVKRLKQESKVGLEEHWEER